MTQTSERGEESNRYDLEKERKRSVNFHHKVPARPFVYLVVRRCPLLSVDVRLCPGFFIRRLPNGQTSRDLRVFLPLLSFLIFLRS